MADETGALRIRVVEGQAWLGQEAALPPGGTLTLGTDPSCGLTLPGAKGVEPTHCVIRPLKGGGFGVKDLGSRAGTLLNGEPVQVARLAAGDRLALGEATLEVQPAGAGTPARRRQPPRPRDLERLDHRISGYHLQEYLGRGSMGTVYRAIQESLQRQVAIKLLRRELTRDPAFVERFIQEAQAAARFNHPNVVHVYDVGHEGDTYFYSMELMDQGSLEEELAERGRLPWEEALRVVRDAARGLRYAEQVGVVHRDIKPDNLMRNSQGVAKIVDLGLAATTGEGAGEEGGEEGGRRRIFGTPHFIAPEQARGDPVDIRSDIYSLGCTFYRLLTGRTPFTGATVKEILRQKLTGEPEPVTKEAGPLPDAVLRILNRMMARDPQERFPTAQELLHELDRLQGGRRRSLWLLPLGGGLALAAAVLAVTLGGPGNGGQGAGPEVDPALQQQLEKTEREKRESQAQAAFLQAQLLAGEARQVEALREVAGRFADTKAGTAAKAKAEELAERLQGLEAARRQRAARQAALLAALDQALARAGAGRDGAALFQALEELPHREEFAAEKAVAERVAAARKEALDLAGGAVEARLAAARAAAEARDPVRLRTELEAAGALLALPTLPEEARQTLAARLGPALAQHQGHLERLVRELAGDRQEADRRLLLEGLYRGRESALAAAAAFDLAGARVRAEALAAALQTEEARILLERRLRLHRGAERAWLSFLGNPGGGLLRRAGKAWALAGLEGGRLRLEERSPDGQVPANPQQQEIGLDGRLLQEEPTLVAALLDPERRSLESPGLPDLACLCTLLGPLATLAEARAWMGRIRPEDPGSGLSPSPPAFGSPLLELAAAVTARAGEAMPLEVRELVAAETGAAHRLAQGMRAFAEGRNLAAAEQLEQLLAEGAETGVYGVLGAGQALLAAAASRPAGRRP